MRSGRFSIPLKEGPTPLAESLMDHPVVGFHARPPKPYDPTSHAQSPFIAWALLVSAIFTKVVILDESGHLPCPQTLELDAVPCMISDMAAAWNWHRKDAKQFLLELAECGLISDELSRRCDCEAEYKSHDEVAPSDEQGNASGHYGKDQRALHLLRNTAYHAAGQTKQPSR